MSLTLGLAAADLGFSLVAFPADPRVQDEKNKTDAAMIESGTMQ